MKEKWRPCLLNLKFVLKRIKKANLIYCTGAYIDSEKYMEILIKFKEIRRRIHACNRSPHRSLRHLFVNILFFSSLQKITILKKSDFAHCSVFTLILNLWTSWACIKSGKYHRRLSEYIKWNLIYIERR